MAICAARRAGVVALAALGIFLAGCASGQDATRPSATTATRSDRPVSDRDEVIRAYTDYWPHSVKAAKLSREEARKVLEPYAEPEHLKKVLDGAAKIQQKNLEPWGYVTVHVLDASVNGRDATVTECQNDINSGIADSRTHELIDGTRGTARVYIRAQMRRGADGRWRLKSKELLEAPCSPR